MGSLHDRIQVMDEKRYLELAQRARDAHGRYLTLRRERDEVKTRCDAAWREYRDLTFQLQEMNRERLG